MKMMLVLALSIGVAAAVLRAVPHVVVDADATSAPSTDEELLARFLHSDRDFEIRGAAGDLVKIALLPRRRSPLLLTGTVTVKRDDGDMLRIDGSPSEKPS